MKLLPSLPLVMMLGALLVGSQGRKISEPERRTMESGIQAGKNFTQKLSTESFAVGIEAVEPFAFPWAAAIGVLTEILGMMAPEDTRVLDSIVKGFNEVNGKLDEVKKQLEEVKDLIQWRDMQVKFADIEYQIRLLDSKLENALGAPDKQDGINSFLRTFNQEYRSAGFALYDSIVNNNQIFSRNLLKAAMKFSKNDRRSVQRFMRGLLSLVVKAGNIEIAEERFTKANRGEASIWKKRILECRDAMNSTDEQLKAAWSTSYLTDVEEIAEEMASNSDHYAFVERVYHFLKNKYTWRSWHVLAYNAWTGATRHSFKYPDHGFISINKHKRNILIVSNDPDDKFDVEEAASYIGRYNCYDRYSNCERFSGDQIILASPDYGAARVVMRNYRELRFAVKSDRNAAGTAELWQGRDYIARYQMLYFG